MKKAIAAIGTVSALVGGYSLYNRGKTPIHNSHDIPSNKLSNGLELKLVQVVFRHGARTPLASPEYLPKVKYTEEMLKHGEHTYVPYDTKSMEGEVVDITKSVYKKTKGISYGELHHGELTSKGADQMHDLGTRLRNHYIKDLKYLSPVYSDLLSVRSTAVKRAVESVRCTLAGMFPEQVKPIPILISSHNSEILYPNFQRCEYLQSLTRWSWFFPDLIEGMEKEREEIQTALGIPLETKVHLVTLRDCLFAHDHHDVLPDEFNRPDVLKKAEMAALKIMDYVFAGYHHTRETALQLGIGPLLRELLLNMQSSADGSSEIKMRLFSGHDTTVMPVLHALDIDQSFWSPFGASIILELYEDSSKKSNKPNHFVRVLYQHEEKVLPGCGEAFCPMEKFQEVVSKFILSDKEYEEKCAIKDDHLLKSVPRVEKAETVRK